MNLGSKIAIILTGVAITLATIGFFIFNIPENAVVGLPADSPPLETKQENSETVKKPAGVIGGAPQATGAYTRLLGESEFDGSIFSAEILDADLITGDSAEFIRVGNSYDETVLPSTSEFCAKIPDLAVQTITKIDSRISIVSARKSQVIAQIANGRKIRDDQKSSIRLQNSDSRDRYVERLTSSSAKNTAHRIAVEKFIASITDAINNRRTAVNASQQAFRQELDEARLAREGLLSASMSVFKNSTNLAFEKAKSDCVAGTPPVTVRTNFHTAFKTAHDKFLSDQSSAEKLTSVIQNVVIARKSALNKALSEFKTSMENARKSFKASFPQGE